MQPLLRIAEETIALRAGFKTLPAPITNASYCLSRDDQLEPVLCDDVSRYAFFDDMHYTSNFQKKVQQVSGLGLKAWGLGSGVQPTICMSAATYSPTS